MSLTLSDSTELAFSQLVPYPMVASTQVGTTSAGDLVPLVPGTISPVILYPQQKNP